MKNNSATAARKLMSRGKAKSASHAKPVEPTDQFDAKTPKTAIALCVQRELRRYFELLDGEEPSKVHHLVMRQAEYALIESVMEECGGNQSKATKWLGISRGNLRNKLADMGYE